MAKNGAPSETTDRRSAGAGGVRKLFWSASALIAIAFLAYRIMSAQREKMTITQQEQEQTYSGIVVAKQHDLESHRFKDITIVRSDGTRTVIPIPSDALFEAIAQGDSVAKESGSCTVEVYRDLLLLTSWSFCH